MLRILRKRLGQLSAVLTVVVTLAGSAWAAEDVLTLLPEKSLGFAVVNRLANVSEKLGKHAQNLGIPMPDLLTMAKASTGVQQGLDDQGVLMVAVVSSIDGSKKIEDFEGLLALPLSDYKQFVEPFGGDASSEITELDMDGVPMLAAEKSGYALLVSNDAEHRSLLEKVLKQDAKVTPEIAVLKKWIAENDAAVVVLAPGIKRFAERGVTEIEKFKKQFSKIEAPGDQAAQMAAAMDMYLQVLHTVEAEVQTVAQGLRIDDVGNLCMGGRVRFTKDGEAAKLSGASNHKSKDLLTDLPGGPFVGAVGASLSPECSELLTKWFRDMMASNPAIYGMELSEEEADELLEASLTSMQGLRGFSMALALSEEGESIVNGLFGIIVTEDAAGYLANYKEAMEQVRKIQKKLESAIPTVEMEATQAEIAGKKGLKIVMDMGAAMSAQGNPPELSQVFEKMFGGDGKITTYLLAIEKNKVLYSYDSEKTIERQIAALNSGAPSLAKEASIAKTTALLPEEASLVAHLSPRGMVAWSKNIAGNFLPPAMLGNIPEFPETPTIGFSAKMVSGGLETELIVPAELPKTIKEYAESMQQ